VEGEGVVSGLSIGRANEPGEGLVLNREGQLVLTVAPSHVLDCSECSNLHVLLLDGADVSHIRHFARTLMRWADRLEGVQ